MSDIIRIPNISKYTQQIINDELILTLRKIYIEEEDFNKLCLKSSKINECNIKNNNNDIISTQKRYRSILNDIWKTMPTQKILQNTTFNCKLTNEKGLNGYDWNKDLNMSIQGKDANLTMIEIIKMIKLNRYSLDMSIKLKEGKEIYFKIN
jgi:hypothetical protein